VSDTRDDADEAEPTDEDVQDEAAAEADDAVVDDDAGAADEPVASDDGGAADEPVASDDGGAADEPVASDDGGVADDGGVRVRELVLLAVAVLAIAGMVFFGLRWKELHDAEVERHDVQKTASQFINALFEWDGATIQEDFDRILAFATGGFEDQAQATFGDDQTRQDLRESQAAERVEDVDIFVQSIHGNSATVFAVVDVTARNVDFPDLRSDTVRVKIGMKHEGGEWKVDEVDLLDGLNLGLPTDPTVDSTEDEPAG
jgi:Mce-associated membrane protein